MYQVYIKQRGFLGNKWKLEKVIMDGFVEHRNIRFFVLEDGTRIEIDTTDCVVTFTKDRNEAGKK